MIGPRIGSAIGETLGPRVGLVRGSAAAVVADRDATSNIYVPSTSAQWTALGLTAPNSLWLCQEASGNLADSIGALTLTATTTPTYQQTATGWTRVGVGLDDNTADRFVAGAAVGPDPTTTSTLWLYYTVLRVEATTARIIGGATRSSSSTTNARLVLSPSAGTNRLSVNCNGVSATGSADHAVGTHAFAFRYDRTNSAVVGYSELEKITGTYAAGVVDGDKGIGGNTSADAVFVYAAMWSGAAAEKSDAQIKSMLQTLGWTIAW